jgi:hypothetical protein
MEIPMSNAAETASTVQDQVLDSIRQNQELILENVRAWTRATEGLTPTVPETAVQAEYPQLKDLVASQFDFAEKLLATQREFAEKLVAASVPTKSEATKASGK